MNVDYAYDVALEWATFNNENKDPYEYWNGCEEEQPDVKDYCIIGDGCNGNCNGSCC